MQHVVSSWILNLKKDVSVITGETGTRLAGWK